MLRIDLILFNSTVFFFFAYYMKKFYIEVTEVLSRIVEIVAEDEEKAINSAKTMYRNCDIVLDASDYILTEFSAKNELLR